MAEPKIRKQNGAFGDFDLLAELMLDMLIAIAVRSDSWDETCLWSKVSKQRGHDLILSELYLLVLVSDICCLFTLSVTRRMRVACDIP